MFRSSWSKALVIFTILGGGVWGSLRIGHYWNGQAAFQSGQEALRLHNFLAAKAHFEQCLRYWPDSAEALLLAAQAARRACDYEAAARYLKGFRRAGGLPDSAELEQALTRAQRGDLQLVEADLWQAAQKDHADAPILLEALVRGYLATYRLNDALVCLNLWLEREPDELQALLWRADIYTRRLSHENALSDYRRAFGLAPERLDIRRDLALALVEARQPVEALEHLNVLREAEPQSGPVLLALSRCQHMQGDLTTADQLLAQLLQAHPDDAHALTERGKVALEDGRGLQAESWLRDAVERSPGDREARYTLVQSLRQNGKEAEAGAEQARLQQLDAQLDRVAKLAQDIGAAPHDPALRYEMALIFLANRETKEGTRWLRSALHEDPLYQPALKTLAELSPQPAARAERPQ
jgi:Tfp pilus assembly protein PilF